MLNHLNPNDYNSRLNNSICLYNGHPVNVSVREEENTFQLTGIHPNTKFVSINIKSTDPLFDISTPPLGWMNFFSSENFALYVERLPVRRWRQGICSTNTRFTPLINGSLFKGGGGRDYIYTFQFEDMILGKFPSLKECISTLKKQTHTVHSIAVDRDVCLAKKDNIYTVWYKKDEVGWITPEKPNILRLAQDSNSFFVANELRKYDWEIQ